MPQSPHPKAAQAAAQAHVRTCVCVCVCVSTRVQGVHVPDTHTRMEYCEAAMLGGGLQGLL